MALKIKRISDAYEMKVFTEMGEYFGDVEDAIVTLNKVFGWKVKATKNSFLDRILGGAKGVIVPHQFVRAMGDIVIISKAAIPTYEEKEEGEAVEGS
ncbi:PRC-barrel domain-containing protein [Candidatus Woesearchaeota archaeon]|nr:PRC-barrel domain-containing protein [Candidatus Woesearchaeota archaeon]